MLETETKIETGRLIWIERGVDKVRQANKQRDREIDYRYRHLDIYKKKIYQKNEKMEIQADEESEIPRSRTES